MSTAIEAGILAKLKAMNKTPYIFPDRLPEGNRLYPATVFTVVDEVDKQRSHDDTAPKREARVTIETFALTLTGAASPMEDYFQTLSHFDGDLDLTFTDVSIRFSMRNPNPTFQDDEIMKDVWGRSMDFFIYY